MAPRISPLLLAGGGVPATFVGALAVNVPSGSDSMDISFPPGTKVGDTAFILAFEGRASFGAITNGGAGAWTKNEIAAWADPSGYYSALFSKLSLEAGDVDGVTVSSEFGYFTLLVVVYRNLSARSLKSTTVISSGTTLVQAGFTKAAKSRGILTFVQMAVGFTSPTPPAGFTSRAGATFGTVTAKMADLLNVARYVNGADIVWTDFPGSDAVAWLVELT